MNAMEMIQRECCECGSRDTVIKGDELRCNECNGAFVYSRKSLNLNGGEL